MHADLLIVGGGPTGLATAIHAAQRGLSTIVLDRQEPPFDKACGESVTPLGVAALDGLGVRASRAQAAPLAGIRLVDEEDAAEATFPFGQGLGMRRTTLMTALVARAEDLGVTLRFGVEVGGWVDHGDRVTLATSRGSCDGRWLVGADGLHSRVRRMAGLALPSRGRPRFGMRRHFATAPWSEFLEIHWGDDVEACVTPTGPAEIGVTLLWSGGGDFETVLARVPALHARLAAVRPLDAARGAGPMRQRARRRHVGNVVLVGDAAGYVDPLAGEGLTLGLRAAAALVDVLAHGRPLAAYERAYRRLARSHELVPRLLLAAAGRPALRRRVIAALARTPESFGRLLGVACGQTAIRSLGPIHAARLAWEIARGGHPGAPDRHAALPTPRA